MKDLQHNNDSFFREDFEHFFEQSLSGFLIADPQGIITKSNTRLANWVGTTIDELKGKRFSDLLTIGSKIYYETHLSPLLRMQGFFDEVLVELNNPPGQKLRVLINAIEYRNEDGSPKAVYCTITKATDRLQYEQNLQYSKTAAEKELQTEKENVLLREQLIAVLGHDLRNPLAAILMATELLENFLLTGNPELVSTLKRSAHRMAELIDNIMDFARTRLGEGIIINKQNIELEPVLQQVIRELKLVFPKREIITEFDIAEPISCDPDRVAQLLSNLLANALTHGAPNTDVSITAVHQNGLLKLSVCNSGKKIPEDLYQRLFAPFTKEGDRMSQNGLGLGLYISAEIARAHNATLICTSTNEKTCFTFEMPS